MSEVLFLCDGKREICKPWECYINGGKCKHTTDISHAKNKGKNKKFRWKNGKQWEHD